MKKHKSNHNFTWLKCFTLIIAVIVVLLLAVNLVQLFRLNEWKDKIEKLESSTIISEIDMQNFSNTSIDLSHFYDALDEKADAAINKVVAVVSILTTVITLFGGLIAFKAPNDVEKRLKEIEDKLEDSNANIEKAKSTSAVLNSYSKKDNISKVELLSSYIDNYNGDEKYLADIYFERGSIYEDMKKFSEAEIDLKYAKNLGFDEDQCCNALGVLYNDRLLLQKDNKEEVDDLFEKAKQYYKKALDITTDKKYKSNVYCNLACLYVDNNNYTEAFELFDESMRINDNNCNAHLNKAITLESMGEEKYQEALKEYTECINKNPEHTLAHKYRIDLAIKILEKDPNNFKVRKYYKDDYEFLSEESHYLNIMEQRYSRITQKHLLDTAIKEIDKRIAELENDDEDKE